MSKETLRYQHILLAESINLLEQSQISEPMIEPHFADLIIVISNLEDIIAISAATDEDAKVKIMNKWL